MAEDLFLISLLYVEIGFIVLIGLLFGVIAYTLIEIGENLPKMKRIICYLIAILDYIKYGVWAMPTY